MNRIVEVEIAGRTYPLNYSVKAMQMLGERFGGIKEIFAALVPEESDGTVNYLDAKVSSNLYFAASVLMDYGARYRLLFDGVECERLTEEQLELAVGQLDYLVLYSAVLEAMGIGASREVETEDNPKNGEATQG